jgi:hypothetical protein
MAKIKAVQAFSGERTRLCMLSPDYPLFIALKFAIKSQRA